MLHQNAIARKPLATDDPLKDKKSNLLKASTNLNNAQKQQQIVVVETPANPAELDEQSCGLENRANEDNETTR